MDASPNRPTSNLPTTTPTVHQVDDEHAPRGRGGRVVRAVVARHEALEVRRAARGHLVPRLVPCKARNVRERLVGGLRGHLRERLGGDLRALARDGRPRPQRAAQRARVGRVWTKVVGCAARGGAPRRQPLRDEPVQRGLEVRRGRERGHVRSARGGGVEEVVDAVAVHREGGVARGVETRLEVGVVPAVRLDPLCGCGRVVSWAVDRRFGWIVGRLIGLVMDLNLHSSAV
jgi:hypothetical protein